MSEIDLLVDRAMDMPAADRPAPAPPAAPKAADRGADGKAAAIALPKPDKYIVAFFITLCVISIIELYSASSREVVSGKIFDPLIRHGLMMFLGILICVGVSRVRLKAFVVLTPVFVFISVMLMVYVLINGDIINGARRSFRLLGIMIQPAELIKISAVLILAYIMSRNQEPGGVKTRGVVMSVLSVLLLGGLLFTQGMTNTLLLMAISLSMMLIGGIQWRKLALVMVFYGFIGAGGVYYKMTHGSEKTKEEATLITETGRDSSGKAATIDRSSTWSSRMNRYFEDSIPKYDMKITATNRQEMYAYMAQANGGLFGVMPGNSRETARLPLAFSDYIYSIVVEDLGFIGGIFLLLVYLSLLARAGTIASRCDRAFPSMLVMGMAVMIVFQALFHMAIVTGVFPVSGQPLPMISKGGTSMLVTSLAFGIMLSISRYATMAGRKKAKKQEADIPESIAAVNPTQLRN